MLKEIKREANTYENDDDEGREFIVYLLHGHYRGERASQGLGFRASCKEKVPNSFVHENLPGFRV
jgi:hypothetical protein